MSVYPETVHDYMSVNDSPERPLNSDGYGMRVAKALAVVLRAEPNPAGRLYTCSAHKCMSM